MHICRINRVANIILDPCTDTRLRPSIFSFAERLTESSKLARSNLEIADGKALTVKEKVEVDDENKSITFNVMEGEILKEFKGFKATGQATAKADGSGSTVKWTLDYEKLNEAVAEPKSYTDAIVKITKDVDAHLLNA